MSPRTLWRTAIVITWHLVVIMRDSSRLKFHQFLIFQIDYLNNYMTDANVGMQDENDLNLSFLRRDDFFHPRFTEDKTTHNSVCISSANLVSWAKSQEHQFDMMMHMFQVQNGNRRRLRQQIWRRFKRGIQTDRLVIV